jgi:hypothetical protein
MEILDTRFMLYKVVLLLLAVTAKRGRGTIQNAWETTIQICM